MKKITKSKGFTLIELLVVIAIIGILAAIVLASLSTARTKANAAKVQGQMDEMRNAAEIYYSTNSGYANGNGAANNGNDNGAAGSDCSGGPIANTAFADSTSGMSGLLSNTIGVAGVTAANVDCGATATAWSVASILPGGAGSSAYFCVDSTGASRGAGAGGNNYTTLVNGNCNATVCGAHATADATVCQ